MHSINDVLLNSHVNKTPVDTQLFDAFMFLFGLRLGPYLQMGLRTTHLFCDSMNICILRGSQSMLWFCLFACIYR